MEGEECLVFEERWKLPAVDPDDDEDSESEEPESAVDRARFRPRFLVFAPFFLDLRWSFFFLSFFPFFFFRCFCFFFFFSPFDWLSLSFSAPWLLDRSATPPLPTRSADGSGREAGPLRVADPCDDGTGGRFVPRARSTKASGSASPFLLHTQ